MGIKDDFFSYLGPANSLAGYSRSYKMVFLTSLFELIDNKGVANAIDVARSFKRYYEDRKKRGLTPDVDVEPRIENVENSTVSQILSVIKDNPYRVINQKGFIRIETINGDEYFSIDQDLFKELSTADKDNILKILRDKLDLYFSKIDGVSTLQSSDPYKILLEEFMSSYIDVRTSTPFGKNPTGAILSDKLPEVIRKLEFIDNSKHAIKGSYGNGNWTRTPWMAIFDKRITRTAQEGVYIVYLFSSNMERVYLTLNQGCTSLKNSLGKSDAIKRMQEHAKEIRVKIKSRVFSTDSDILVGHELYEKGCIYYKEYKKGEIPEDIQLLSDLEEMVKVYQDYYQQFITEDEAGEKHMIETNLPTILKDELDVKDEIARISSYIKSKGFTFADDLIMNFYLALKSKPFVILAGTSGTGKSKLTRLFAEAIGATSENERFKLIAVRPDWSDSTDLLGYRDLNGEFQTGVLTNVILKAINNPEHPYFICLDEMNLARVEYYLSDILSIMESRKWSNERIVTDKLISQEYLGSNAQSSVLQKDIIIPDNLYIIGTVNMDETTFPFSKKVLDRANTIEFSYVDLDIRAEKIDEAQPEVLNNSFLKSNFLLLEDCIQYEEVLNETIAIQKELNIVLQAANLHFGYRIRDEICFYIVYNHKYDLLSFHQAMDNVILQKILPRIQGSSGSIKRVLIDLFKVCINNSTQLFSYDNIGIYEEMSKYILNSKPISYKKSAEKIAFMMRRFEEDGFTSYWQ